MSDETPRRLTSTESRPVMRHRAACTCTWRGEWHLTREEANADALTHSRTHAPATVP